MQAMNKIIMTLAGLLLIVAAVLKFHEMVDTCVPSWEVKAHVAVLAAEKAGEQIPQWKATVLGIWESYEFFLFQVPLEFALGVWMVCGLFRKASWIAGMLAYFGFIFVTITKVLTGAESCGCFGQITVDPKITLFAMDIPVFLLLALFQPKRTKLLPPPWPNLVYLLLIFVPTIGLIVTAPPVMVGLRPDCKKAADDQPDPSAKLKLEIYKLKQDLQKQSKSADSLRQQIQTQQQSLEKQKQQIESLNQQVLILKQNQQQKPPKPNQAETTQKNGQPPTVDIKEPNKPKPVDNGIEQQTIDTNDTPPGVEKWDWLKYVVEDDIRQQISEGLVVVMMNRYDCSVCEEMAPRYSDYYQQMINRDAVEFKIAFLSIPPYGDTDHVPDDTACIVGKLTDEEKWELMSPYVVALLDGELIKTWEVGTAPEPENIIDEVFE